jgi:hypothetical protein
MAPAGPPIDPSLLIVYEKKSVKVLLFMGQKIITLYFLIIFI